MKDRTTDLQEAAAPRDVAKILRTAAELYYVSAGELESAWQDKNAGKPWERISKAGRADP